MFPRVLAPTPLPIAGPLTFTAPGDMDTSHAQGTRGHHEHNPGRVGETVRFDFGVGKGLVGALEVHGIADPDVCQPLSGAAAAHPH